MADMNHIKQKLIDRISESEDEKLLLSVEKLLATASGATKIYELSALEKELLHLSEEDIRYGRVISEEDLDAMDSEWMEEK